MDKIKHRGRSRIKDRKRIARKEDLPKGRKNFPRSGTSSNIQGKGSISMEKDVKIRRIHSSGEIVTEVLINGQSLEAVVDTAADISIISKKVFEDRWEDVGLLPEKMELKSAGEGQSFIAYRTEPVQIELGEANLVRSLWVAPINDPMLLGLDILKEVRATIDIGTGEVKCKARKVRKKYQEKVHGKMLLSEAVTIPPESWMVCQGWIPDEMNSDMFALEGSSSLPVLMANALYKKHSQHSISIINQNKEKVTLRKGTCLGKVYPVEDVADSENVMSSEAKVRRIEVKKRETEMLPERLKPIWTDACKRLDGDYQDQLFDLLEEFQDVFAHNDLDLGTFNAMEHHIDTGNSPPVKLGLRRCPVHYIKEEDEMLKNMLEAGVIRPSISSWAAAPVLVRRKDGKVRWCIDYRALNACTRKDVYPLPLMTECTDSLDQNVWFSKLDANSAYWQIPVAEESKEKTAFRTRHGLFEFNRLAFGLCNAPSTFSRAMSLVLQGMSWKTVLAFLDDICILGKSKEDHLNNLGDVFRRFRKFGLKLKPKKCSLFCKEVEFLGRLVGVNGVTMTDQSLETIREWRAPKSVKEVEKFLGLANFHRVFIKDYARVAEPMTRLLKKKTFFWGKEQQESFEELKTRLLSPPVLAIPQLNGSYILDCDASGWAVSGELLQIQDGQERAIAYGSFALSALQKTYCSTRKELLALVRMTNHFRHYLLGRSFKIRTDHHSLKWIMNFKHAEGQLARWLEELSRFHMDIEFRPGKSHGNADALSRIPQKDCSKFMDRVELKDLPCGGCSYCSRIEKNRREFERLVDDVVELSRLSPNNKTKGQPDNFSSIRRAKLSRVPKGPCEDIPLRVSIGDKRITVEKGKVCIVRTFDDPSLKVRKTTSNKAKAALDKKDEVPEESDLLNNWSNDCWRTYQRNDEDLIFLSDWLDKGTIPEKGELMLAGPAKKFYWTNKELFFLAEGIIFYKNDKKEDIVVVPKALREEVMRMCHDATSAAHQGRKRTQDRLNKSFFWFRCTKDIKNHIEACSPCARNGVDGKKPKYPHAADHAGIPMERIHMDFVGPLPKTEEGNEYVLVIVDNFTKWTECVALPSQTAEVTARAAVNDFFSRMGCANQLITDQGRNFESALFQELCKLLDIKKSRTTSYRPKANGQVERANKVLGKALRCFAGKGQKDWDKFIPLIAAVMRASVNKMTGFTPNMMMLGREVRMPSDLLAPATKDEPVPAAEHVRQLQDKMREIHELARDHLKAHIKYAKRKYDVNAKINTFKMGDAVLFKNNAPRNKLCHRYLGPGIIRGCLTPFLFKVFVDNTETKVMHHDQLKAFAGTIPKWAKKEVLRIQEGREEVICICQRPDDGRPIVQCDTCKDWFHCNCMKLTRRKAMALPSFTCPNCQSMD